MITQVHKDETAPKRERWRVLRAADGATAEDGRWITVESFGTSRDAFAFMRGFEIGSAYAPAPEPLEDRLDRALDLVKLARDDYKSRVRDAQAVLRNPDAYSDPVETALRRLTDTNLAITTREETAING